MRGLTGRQRFFSRCGCCAPGPVFTSQALDRRSFLAGGTAAVGVGLAAPTVAPSPALAQAPAKRRRIDVHHHVIPPAQAEAFAHHRGTSTPKLTPAMSLEDMDKAGIDTAIVSILNPGVWFGTVDEEARKLARDCNEWQAKLEQDHPGRFLSFAVIPLPDTEGSLREIEYSLDVLKAQGIALWTMYSGKYLGDPAFVPVFEELNRRKAVVYTHPTVPDCCAGLVPGVPVSTLEYNQDTTRTIASLVFGKGETAFKTPDVKYIWSHSGGTLPFMTSRFEDLASRQKDRFPNGALPIFQRFYYEVAQGNTPGQLAALMQMVKVPQVMLGSDFPFRKGIEAVEGVAHYDFSDADRRAIESENAIRVMPGLKA